MMHWKKIVGASLALCAAVAWSTASGAPGAAPPFVPGTAANYTAQELREIKELVKDMERFKKAAQSYRETVNTIVKRAYEKRRRSMMSTFRKKIRTEEAEERVRRIAAITLFEDFLRRYPNDKRWTPDVIFRLAELYFEKSNDEYLQATDRYDKDMQKFEAGQLAVAPTPPKQDYSQTIELHRRLIREFPRYRLVDGAYYLLGFCLSEMGKLERGNEGFLSLVCSNRYRPPLTDVEPSAAAGPDAPDASADKTLASRMPALTEDGRPVLKTTAYDGCVALKKKSRFNPEAWIRIGEYHFDENQLGEAIAAYQKVLEYGSKDNTYYDSALYKLAWTHYRVDRFMEAIKEFDRLVVFADKTEAETGKKATEMRPESIQYLGISFAEEDWDGDTIPDPETGIQRIEKFYGARTKEKHVYEVYRRLADIYFDTTKYDDSIKVYKMMLQRWPYRPGNPEIQDKVIMALERQRKFEEAITEREEFTRMFGKGTEWEKRNRNNPKALKKAREIDEQALIQAAVFHHKAAKSLRDRAVAMGDGSLVEQAKAEYALAARAYEKYLERFPNTKNSYEIRYSYASCLFYSQRFLEAGKAFAEVRDSNLDNRYMEEAAFSATKSYEEYIQAGIRAGSMANPPLPKASDQVQGKPTPKAMPDAYKKWMEALDAYHKRLPNSPKTPRLTYKAAEIAFRFYNFDDARKRFAEIYKAYCKDPMALNAAQAVLVTYQLEKDTDNMERWATRLKSGKCGGTGDAVAKTAKEAGKLIMGIRFKRAMTAFKAQQWDKAAKAFLDLVAADPKGEDAPTALNNAGVCYEKSKRYESATKIYERIWKEYPKSKFAPNALWLAAQNYKRFFEFERAVQNFLILADSPRFASSEHRVDAIYNAAVILENDQAYERAAKLFLRYAKQVGKPKDAAEAYFRAGLIYEKMNDFGKMVQIFRSFPRLHGSAPGQGRYAVEAMYRIADNAKKRNDWATAAKYYRLTIAEYNSRGQQPASDAAEYAANAAFDLAERKLEKDFLKMEIKGAFNTLMRQKKRMEKKAVALKLEYEAIWNYKRARWTLASMYRRGTIFEHFARSMDEGFRNAPIPRKVKRLGQEAIDIYLGQVDQILAQQVDPITEQAKKLYKDCIDRAKQLGISNRYTEEAYKKLNAFDPMSYPLMKRAKVERVIE